MLKFSFAFLFTLLGFWTVGQEKENSLYWEIRSPSSGQISYLFGTMHLVDKDKLFLPKKIKRDLAKSDALVLELNEDIEKIDEAAIVQAGFLPEGQRATDFLEAQQLDSFYFYVRREFGMDSAQFENTLNRFSPYFLVDLPYMQHAKGQKGMEDLIRKIAKQKKLPIIGLETIEFQLQVMQGLPDSLYNECLMDPVRDSLSTKERWETNQNLYLEQRVLELLGPESATVDGFTDRMLTKRNQKWQSKLNPLLHNQSNFIAVGAAHLYGSIGLIQLLRNQGFICTPVEISLLK